ncbi:hypothetical protein TNCV_4147991 [Trichonephila clavipes]|nr:hypothetical protein TNCV_4147991 [Trichonephila clavipes]
MNGIVHSQVLVLLKDHHVKPVEAQKPHVVKFWKSGNLLTILKREKENNMCQDGSQHICLRQIPETFTQSSLVELTGFSL